MTHTTRRHLPDWVIRAQFGHVSPAVYSHFERKAVNEAAEVLEPDAVPSQGSEDATI
jgi:hypothetical protein